MSPQDADSSVTTTLTCLITDVSDFLNVTWFSKNENKLSASSGYLAKQGKVKFNNTRFDYN